jgi:hypothetical protein
MIPNEKNLLLFATKALEILQEHEDWSDETPEAIAMLAYDLGLAKTGDDGLFEIIE